MAYFALSFCARIRHEWQTLRGQTTSVAVDEPSRKASGNTYSCETGFPLTPS